MNIPAEDAVIGGARGHETQRKQYEARLEARLREAIQPLLRYGVPLEDAMCAAVVIHRISLLCGYDRALRMLTKGLPGERRTRTTQQIDSTTGSVSDGTAVHGTSPVIAS